MKSSEVSWTENQEQIAMVSHPLCESGVCRVQRPEKELPSVTVSSVPKAQVLVVGRIRLQ
jgi:hypothetical protein